MSKKILFLYSTQKHKAQLQLCESVFKAILRKFRKSALFSYMQIDLSPSQRTLMKDILVKELSRYDAVFINGDMETLCLHNDFIKDVLSPFSTEHYAAGRVIFFPEDSVNTEQSDDAVTQIHICLKENIAKAAKESAKAAKERKKTIAICTQAGCCADNIFLREAEYALAKERHLDIEHIYLDEMISLCMKTIPSFDVVLTSKQYAKIIAMHLNSLPNSPTGYFKSHTEHGRIYHRQVLPHEEMNNTPLASATLAFAAILENELKMKSAAGWLRRAVSLAYEKCACALKEDFIHEVICEIEIPMRKQRVK